MLNFFRNTVYIRVKPDRLSVLHVESGKEFAEIPALAFKRSNGKNSVIAVGREANTKAGLPDVIVANGFKHPRTLIADFTVAEQTLKQFLKKVVASGTFFAPSPTVVIHPLDFLEGGLTQLEIRAFAELCIGAGARKVFVWTGSELSKDELRALRFPSVGGQLLHP